MAARYTAVINPYPFNPLILYFPFPARLAVFDIEDTDLMSRE
jgi:hypothetical protein